MAAIETYADLRRSLAARRVELGMSPADLDREAGLPPGFAEKFEAGRAYLNSETTPGLLKALGLQIAVKPKEN